MDFESSVLDSEERSLFFRIMALPLITEHHITSEFMKIKASAKENFKDNFNKFITYFEKKWINQTGVKFLSFFNNLIGISNSLELYDGLLYSKIERNTNRKNSPDKAVFTALDLISRFSSEKLIYIDVL